MHQADGLDEDRASSKRYKDVSSGRKVNPEAGGSKSLTTGGKRPARQSVDLDNTPVKKRRGATTHHAAGSAASGGVPLSEGSVPTIIATNNPGSEGDSSVAKDLGDGERRQETGEEECGEEDDEDKESLQMVWEDSVLNLRRSLESLMMPTPDEERRAELIEKHRIGGAYIHAFGIGHVYGVVDINDEDPNSRGNPRAINETHAHNLFEVFSVPGAKRDHESPIIVTVPRELLSIELLGKMGAANPRDPTAKVPALQLSHPSVDRLRQAEEEQLSQIKDGKWMTEKELLSTRSNVAGLRKAVPKARLMNGNHRIDALVRLGAKFAAEQDTLTEQVRHGEITRSEVVEAAEKLKKKAAMTTYRVEVYDANLPPELANWLVRNDDQRPAMGMGPGERAWWTALRWDHLLSEARRNGEIPRATAANRAYAIWAMEAGGALGQGTNDADGAAVSSGKKSKRASSHRRGGWAGGDTIPRLFTAPLTMEMVMDTRSALCVYNQVFRPAISVAMLQPTGGLLVSHFWLACRTLIQVFNVADGDGLTDAERYVNTTPTIMAGGYKEAARHWKNLHSRPESLPRFLKYYDEDFQTQFDELYADVLKNVHPTRGIEWDDGVVASRVRQVFEVLGKRIQGKKPTEGGPKGELCWAVPVGVSMRLLARLPIDEGTPSPGGAVFCPAAALPAKRWLDCVCKKGEELKSNGDDLTILECLMERYLPVWSIGAQTMGTSQNPNNWYRRSRGLHQVTLRMFSADHYGSIDQRLQKAILLLSDARLGIALRSIQEDLGNDLRQLLERCRVLCSKGAGYPVLKDLSEESLRPWKSTEQLEADLSTARKALRPVLFHELAPTAKDYRVLRAKHPVLDHVLAPDFWGDWGLASWVTGWNGGTEGRFRSVRAIVGWGLAIGRVIPLLERLMENRDSRHLLELCTVLAEATRGTVWWEGQEFAEDDRPSPPATPERRKEKGVDRGEGRREGGEAKGGESGVLGGDQNEAPRHSPEWSLSAAVIEPKTEGASGPPEDGLNPSSQQRTNPARRAKTASQQIRLPKDGPTRKKRALRSSQRSGDAERPTEGGASSRSIDGEATSERGESEEVHSDTGPQEAHTASVSHSQASNHSISSALRSGHVVWSMVRERIPVHIMTPPSLAKQTYDYVRGCGIYDNKADVESLKKTLERKHSVMDKLCWLINSERQELRDSLFRTARLCVESTYGGYFAGCGLASVNSIYKDIYVARVAKILAENLGMPEEEAMTEAAALARSDGLYSTEVSHVDEDGELTIELSGTFAQGIQGNIKDNESLISIGTLPGRKIEREETLRWMEWMHFPRGVGRTEAESADRGLLDARLLSEKIIGAENEPARIICMNRAPTLGQPVTRADPYALGELNDYPERWNVGTIKVRELHLTQQPKRPGLSTGVFIDPERQLPTTVREDMWPVECLVDSYIGQDTEVWEDAQQADLLAYQGHDPFDAHSGANSGSRFQPVETDEGPGQRPGRTDGDPILEGLIAEGGMRSPDSDERAAMGLLRSPTISQSPTLRYSVRSSVRKTPPPAEVHSDEDDEGYEDDDDDGEVGGGEEDAEGETDDDVGDENRVEGREILLGHSAMVQGDTDDEGEGGISWRGIELTTKRRRRGDSVEYDDVGGPQDSSSEGSSSGGSESLVAEEGMMKGASTRAVQGDEETSESYIQKPRGGPGVLVPRKPSGGLRLLHLGM